MNKDIIYREDAIKAMEQRYEDILRTFKRKVKVGEKAIVLDMIGCLKNMPSADRPSGEWIDTSSGEHWKCSVCGCRAPYYMYKSGEVEWVSDYCPNCGARMKGAGDETN